MILPIVLALLAETAPPPPAASAAERPGGHAFISPMGEPFVPEAGGVDGLQRWFEQADSDRNGALTVQEFKADSDRFFRSLDIKADGEIDPDDLSHYEEDIAPQGQYATGGRSGGDWNPQDGGRHGAHHHRSGGVHDGPRGGGRDRLIDGQELVASADADFNRGVSRAEFERAAGQRFLLLDTNHDGKLTMPELQVIVQANAEAARHRPHHYSSSESQSTVDPGNDPGGMGY
jgi:Ca2+-binding EF-hand superfamily protein